MWNIKCSRKVSVTLGHISHSIYIYTLNISIGQETHHKKINQFHGFFGIHFLKEQLFVQNVQKKKFCAIDFCIRFLSGVLLTWTLIFSVLLYIFWKYINIFLLDLTRRMIRKMKLWNAMKVSSTLIPITKMQRDPLIVLKDWKKILKN